MSNTTARGPADRLSLKGVTDQTIHDRILEGFSFAAFARFEKESGMPRATILGVMHLPERTLARRKESGRLSADESERLFRLATLFHQAVELFAGSTDAATRWLHTKLPALGNRAAVELARTEVGARQVETLIHQLEHGVYV